LFAAVHDDLQATASPVADGGGSIVRMALAAGRVVGPVLLSVLATAAGPSLGTLRAPAAGSRVMLAATGACALAQIVPMGFARASSGRPGPARPGAHTASEARAERPVRRPGIRQMLP